MKWVPFGIQNANFFSHPIACQMDDSRWLPRFGMCLAVFDLVALQQSFFILLAEAGIDILKTDWSCRVSNWVCFGAKYSSSWTLVGIALERCIVVARPYMAKIRAEDQKWCI